MILVKHLLGMFEVEIVLRLASPWKVKHELDVVVLDAVVRRSRIVFLQLCHLLLEDFLNSRRPEFLFSTGAELGEFLHFIHSEFFLDGLELIVQEIFPLLLVHLGFHLLVDFLLDFLEFQLVVKKGQKLHSPRPEVGILQESCLLVEIFYLYRSCNEIHKEFKTVNALQGADSLPRHHVRCADDG